MPSASLSGTSGCGHKRWLRVRVPAVAVLGCSLFWFLFLVWAPMHLDCRVRHGGGGGGGSGGSASGNGEEERAREDAAWVVATGALDESVVMAVVQPQGGGTSGGASGRSFKRRRRRRRKVLAVLGLHTGFDALQRRKSLRETWVPSTPQGTARYPSSARRTGVILHFPTPGGGWLEGGMDGWIGWRSARAASPCAALSE